MVHRVVMIEPMGRGGVAHYTFRLCQALASQGIHCALITVRSYELSGMPRSFALYPILPDWSQPGAGLRPRPSRVGRLARWRRRWRSLVTLSTIVSVVLKERSDVIHAQWIAGPHDRKLFRMLRLLGKRIVYTAHNVLPHEAKPEDEARVRSFLRQVDQAIVHSQESFERFGRTFPDMRLPVHVVPMGDFDVFPQDYSSKVEARRHIGVPDTGPVVLFFGAIRPYKGLMDLLRAFKAVFRELPEARLLVAGDPYEDFETYAAEIRTLGLQDQVICRLGYHPMEQVPPLFRAADVVALPYKNASQSAVVQVAFAMGVPVVATRVGGIPEVVEDGRTGVLVDSGDVEGLAAAILRLLQDPVLAETLAGNARAIASVKHSWTQIARRTAEIYRLATVTERADRRRASVELT